MNRIVVFGAAIFFAVVCLALLGGEKKAEAGHRCHGCNGAVACDGAAADCGGDACHGACHGRKRCHGRERCHGKDRCHGRKRCHGGNGCNGGCDGAMEGEGGGEAGNGEVPPPPEGGEAYYQRTPLLYRLAIFRR